MIFERIQGFSYSSEERRPENKFAVTLGYPIPIYICETFRLKRLTDVYGCLGESDPTNRSLCDGVGC